MTRADFEPWIAADIAEIEATIDRALERATTTASRVDAVFMTGGAPFAPAVRRLSVERFGREKFPSGDAFSSAANGPALVALDRSPAGRTASAPPARRIH